MPMTLLLRQGATPIDFCAFIEFLMEVLLNVWGTLLKFVTTWLVIKVSTASGQQVYATSQCTNAGAAF